MKVRRCLAGLVFRFAAAGFFFPSSCGAADSAAPVRSVASAKRPQRTFAAQSLAVPLAPTMKSYVHQRSVVLSALASDTLEDLTRQDASVTSKRLRIGIPRDFPSAVDVNAQAVPANSWTVLPDGERIWAIKIASPGAIGLRVHVENIRLDSRARLIVYNPANAPATATLIPGEMPGTDTGVWTPTIFGEQVVLECQLPAGVEPEAAAFSVTGTSHLYRTLKSASPPQAGSCEEDISCFPEWKPVGEGVASIDFVEKGTTYLCSGCLLNDADDATFANYFLTAHHCLNSKSVAATLEA